MTGPVEAGGGGVYEFRCPKHSDMVFTTMPPIVLWGHWIRCHRCDAPAVILVYPPISDKAAIPPEAVA